LNSFKTYHNPVVVTSLSIITQIVGLGLPSFKQLLKKFLNRIFKLFQQTQATDSDFTNSLFKCISELIKNYAANQDLSDYQIKALVQIIRDSVDKHKIQGNALQCLRSVVHRKYTCADLYDLIETVQEMMISSVHQLVRGLCSGVFVQFLLDYPLENSRVEQHISFLLKNLAFKQESGRIQLLQTLQTLIVKFPARVVDIYGELLFFSLLLRLVNDPSADCRLLVTGVLTALVSAEKVSQNKLKAIFNSLLKMGEHKDQMEPGKRDQLLLAKLYGL